MQRLGIEITSHLFGRTVLNREFMRIDMVGDEIEATIDMFGSFVAGLATILFEENSTLVVLVQNSILMAELDDHVLVLRGNNWSRE